MLADGLIKVVLELKFVMNRQQQVRTMTVTVYGMGRRREEGTGRNSKRAGNNIGKPDDSKRGWKGKVTRYYCY